MFRRYSNSYRISRPSHLVKGRPVYGRRSPRSHNGFSGLFLFTFILLSIILLILGKSENRQLAKIRQLALDFTSPVLEYTAIPAGYIQRSVERIQNFYHANRELSALRRENDKLKNTKWNVEDLRQRNSQLRALLNAVEEPRLKYVSGRVLSGNPGLFGKHMLINLGRQNGINSGFAVINQEGFIGRTVNTGNKTSRVLLLTDKSSRVPVIIGKEAVRGVAIGTGSHLPEIRFIPPNSKIYEGDLVFTSGHGGDLPKGLAIGVVKKTGDRFQIATRAQHEGTDYVSILFFDQPGLANKP